MLPTRPRFGALTLLLVAFFCLMPGFARAEALLQLFQMSYMDIAKKMPELAEAGYTALWLPPPTKGSGGLSVGYDLWDPFDFGSKDQRSTVRTRYGTEAELMHMIEVAHRFGIRIYFDNIMNHRAFDIPGFNETTPTGGEGQDELYPGMVPEDFHLRKTEDGFYRKWDNTRDWQSAWQVQNLGLSDLIDIAHETPNANHGFSEGSTHPKYSFVRDLNRPEQYDQDKDGKRIYFGWLIDRARTALGSNATTEQLRAHATQYIRDNRAAYVEDVGAYLIRAVRFKMDRLKIDGLRLDAVKHVPDYFYGQMSGANKDSSDAGYLGGAQLQFNISRGFTDSNHRDSVFEDKRGRDDAMMFGEHLGQPPGYGGYWDSGMRLVDNDLRSLLNNRLGNPGATLAGLDASGAGGFPASLGVTHANSHDSDFAAQKEWQHAYYMFREGMGLVYTDGYYKAGTLGESGGAFPRHANTNFLGQFGDPRIPNIMRLHNDFSRGLQQGRWADGDFLAFERRDNRDKFGNTRSGTASEEITMIAMFNDNTAQGQSRPITSSFWSGAYLWQYAEGPNGSFMGGFYKYAGELGTVVVPPGGYYLFSWRTPELSTLWPQAAVTFHQNGQEVNRITVTRKDGPDGDQSFNPYGLQNRGYPAGVTPPKYTYQTTVPVVKSGNFTILARADGSAENIWLKLNGGIDLNGTVPQGVTDPGKRDHQPGVYSDIWVGYEQPAFHERQHAEKFAAKDTTRCQIGSPGAETYVKTIGGNLTINNGPANANNYGNASGTQASWIYHDPDDNVGGISTPPKQFDDSGSNIVIWAKSNSVGGGFKAFVYYTVDGSFPEGAGGYGRGSTRVAELNWRHNQGADDWWGSVNIPKPTAGAQFAYKIGFYRTGASSIWPSGPSQVDTKKRMLTTFRVENFNPTTVQFFPHNDYARVPTIGADYTDWPWDMQTGLPEGFHVVRARAHLNRDQNSGTPLYNTFTQVFYYDALTPNGTLLWPQNNGDTVGGSSYELVLRTDKTVEEVWFHIDDSDDGNDDATMEIQNGNGAGFEPFDDANQNGVRDSGEDFTDLDGDGQYDAALTSAWSQATQNNSINLPGQKEWRFRYNNIPASGEASIRIRLLEPSSSRNLFLDPTTAHTTEVVRTVQTRGPDQRVNIAWPQRDGDRVDDNYTMKVYFTKALADGINEETLKQRFTFSIASTENGSNRDAVVQSRSNFIINYHANDQFHELAIPLPNLYNDIPDFLHTLTVTYTFPDNRELEAIRKVRANPSTKPFVRITRPSEVGSDGRPTEIILPDRPGADQLLYSVRVETNSTVGNLTLTGNPAITLFEEPFTDSNSNGVWDDQEPSTDTNKNNQWDSAESFTDTNTNGIWDLGEAFTDTNNNGVRDPAESYTDLNNNNQFDTGEGFFDLNDNKLRDPAEPFTDTNANGTREGTKVTVSGNTKTWDFSWNITAPGTYLLTATATLNSQSTSTARNARVLLRQIVDSDLNQSNDDDHDGLIDIDETNKKDLPATNAETWSNGDVHIHRASGLTLPTSPDSDGDGLPDGLEVGWRVAGNLTNNSTDTNGDGIKNFVPDLDPPFYAVVSNNGKVPGVGSLNQGDDRARQAAGSVTDPAKADTDGDGISDGIEDANINGWTDGDGVSMQPTWEPWLERAWPNNKIDAGETWTETSPTKPDCDEDALQDGFGEDKNFNGFIDGDTNKDRNHNTGELWSETDPLKSDSDGDGLPDGWEVQYGLDPLDDGAFSKRLDGQGNVNNGPNGDPDNDGFNNAAELLAGTHPTQPTIIGGGQGEGSISIGKFTDWGHQDLLVLDEYGEGSAHSASDVYRSWNDTDHSRDMLSFSFRDGGEIPSGGDGRVYFRIDFLDLADNAWQGEVDAYIVIDTGNTAAGERSIPNEVDIATDMRWEAVVAVYGQNFGSIFVDRNSAQNTTTQTQNPVTEGGVESRNFGGRNEAQWSSPYDAVEIGIERQHLKDAGWLGDPNSLNFQVFVTKPNTTGNGTGDIGGRNDIRDSIYDDWVASDYWRDFDNVALNGKLASWFSRSGANDRNKSAKVMLVAHGNQAMQPGSVIHSLIRGGTTNATTGYSRMLEAHEQNNAPLTLHLTPTLASALQWASSSNNSTDGPAFNTRIRNLISQNRLDLVGSSFSDHVPKYFLQEFNNANKALSEKFLDSIYGNGTQAASRQIFWPTERVLDTTTVEMIRNMGYTYTFADQMRHFVKWFGRSAALGTAGYRINEVNGLKIIPIHDAASEYLDQVRDGGSAMPIRQLLSRRSRSGVQDQVAVLWRDMGDFSSAAKSDSYASNVRWLGSRPWIRVVTAQQIVDNEVSYKGQDGNTYNTWGTEQRGTGQTLVQTAKDWVDWASGENYDHWYFGSPRETGLRNQTFNTPSAFGWSGNGTARDAWLASNSTTTPALRDLSGAVLHAAMFQTAFHNTPDGSLQKFSTGDYIYPDNGGNQTLAPFARHAQSQARFAKIYERVQQWASTANSTTLGTQSVDVDLDSTPEYLLFNSRIFAVFESKGGRMTAAWLRSPTTGKIWQVAGNFAAYSNTDTEDEGTSNPTAFRTSGFKDWWTIGGTFGAGNSTAVNANYTPTALSGNATGWQFSSSGITKAITLANAWTGNITATYTLSGPNEVYVRFGLSPNLLDLKLRGQQGLTANETITRSTLTNVSGNETVRAWVAGPIVTTASDNPGNATTIARRNQAQTHQVEARITNNTIVTLGFDEGTDITDPGSATDGIPNSWWDQQSIAQNQRTASADPDNDGLTNLQEYIFGSNPTSAGSGQPARTVSFDQNGRVISFPTVSGRSYQLQARGDLVSGTWENVGSSVPGDGSTKSVPDTTPASRRFYRIVVSVTP
ncbi:MAG: hypothetical protein KGR46_06820 [Verrucomicrobia bacterium]|nr:hypothetical protein [Verrucomicrobiota bacterium]